MKERPILFSGAMVRALLDGSKTQTRRVIKDQSIGERFSHMTDAGLAHLEWLGEPSCGSGVWDVPEYSADVASPYGQPGDRLWVRESGVMHALLAPEDPQQPMLFRHDVPATEDLGHYWVQHTRAPGASYSTECTREQFLRHSGAKVVPSIHMPRWASRITLEITSVRVERLQDISEADADAEGCERLDAERYDRDPKLCSKCGGTRLHNAIGSGGGVIFDVDCLECDTYAKRYRNLWESINGPGSWDANPWVWVVEFKPPTTA